MVVIHPVSAVALERTVKGCVALGAGGTQVVDPGGRHPLTCHREDLRDPHHQDNRAKATTLEGLLIKRPIGNDVYLGLRFFSLK